MLTPDWLTVIAPGEGSAEINRTASAYQRPELRPLTQVKVITGLETFGVMVPIVSQTLLVLALEPLENAAVVEGNVVAETPLTLGLTTMAGVSS